MKAIEAWVRLNAETRNDSEMLILQISAGLIIVSLTLAFISNEFAGVLSRSLEAALEWVEYKSALYYQRHDRHCDQHLNQCHAQANSPVAWRAGVGDDDHIVDAQTAR